MLFSDLLIHTWRLSRIDFGMIRGQNIFDDHLVLFSRNRMDQNGQNDKSVADFL